MSRSAGLTVAQIYERINKIVLGYYGSGNVGNWWNSPFELFGNKTPKEILEEGNGADLLDYIEKLGK